MKSWVLQKEIEIERSREEGESDVEKLERRESKSLPIGHFGLVFS
jgi:hypothetical protein